MKTYFFKLSKTKRWLLVGSLLIAVLAVYFLFFRGSGNNYELATATRQNLVEDVAITGNIKAAESVIYLLSGLAESARSTLMPALGWRLDKLLPL